VKILGYEIRREQKAAQFEDVLSRLLAARGGSASIITPENCEQSPTVKAIVTAVSNRLSVTPVHVYRKGASKGRETKELLPNHPVAKLLAYPNSYQTRVSFWADATSSLVRYGNFYAYKGRGKTGPIRTLEPMKAGSTTVEQDINTGRVRYRYGDGGKAQEYTQDQILHVRGAARDYVCGDSPVRDVATTIALEVAAEQFGVSFFNNGALPLMIFRYMQGSQGFKTAEAEKQFIDDFQAALGGEKRHRAMLLPKGLETGDPVKVENDKAQMIETRRYQRSVIAGAFGVPPTYVGDLERATFNNVEQQTIQFTSDVILPVAQRFEAALERDLLTEEDWTSGVVIRFNLDSVLRADFKSRQEGLQIQRTNGVISPNEWRELEGKNPLADDKGGEDYLRPGNMLVAGEDPEEPTEPTAPAPAAEDPEDKSITINVPVNVHTRVDGTTVDVKGSTTSVETPASHITNNLPEQQAPTINVEATKVSIQPAEVTVYAPPPEINIVADVKSPTVHVNAPDVRIENNVTSPTVNVEAPNVSFEATIPETKVEIQPITIKAPDVHIRNEIPEYEQIETAAVRDALGRIEKTVTTKKRKR
jgi:HK97 family phage portal protein